jgi:hypothetical protein
MEYWPNNDWLKMLETLTTKVSTEVDQYFQALTEEVTEIFDELREFPDDIFREAEEFGAELNQLILTEVEDFFQQFIDPIFEFEIEVDEVNPEAEIFINYVEPSPEQYPACVGCQNYHGYVYGGNVLVCGMHPYGWEDKECPDWEPK